MILTWLAVTPVHAAYSLPEAVKYAIAHSPTLDSAQRQSAIAELQYRNTTAAFLPSLDLTGSVGAKQSKLPGQAPTEPPWTSDVNLALTETLYDNGVAITNHRISGLAAEIARINFEGARAKLALDVSTGFYAYSLSRKLLDVARGKTSILDKQFANVSAQYRQGLRSRQDFLRFKTQVQQAQIDQLNAESSIKTSLASLRTLLGVAIDDQQPLELAIAEPVPLDTARDVPGTAPSIDGVYAIRTGRLQLKVNELNETFARRLWLPQLSLTGGATYDNNGSLDGPNAFSANNNLTWQGQLALTYNIWDWGTKWRNVEVAGHTRGQQDDTVTSTFLSTKQGIDTLMVQLGTVSESYRLAVELLTLSQQSYSFLEEQYRLGKIAYLDLITGLNDLLTAKTQYLNAYFNLLEDLAQYHYYEGTIYERTVATH